MKTYCWVEAELHAFLTLVLHGGEWITEQVLKETGRNKMFATAGK
jgi:hypothetical protein